ncbi:MAG: hypothetical protein JEZ07_02935 [Phycisphaerae bacterium]|nr:hypothetical protein [Phycisphaerae bacterium]
MSLNDSNAKIMRATKDLLIYWENVKATWRDANSRQFEELYFEPLQIEVRKAQRAMELMESQLQFIKNTLKD